MSKNIEKLLAYKDKNFFISDVLYVHFTRSLLWQYPKNRDKSASVFRFIEVFYFFMMCLICATS